VNGETLLAHLAVSLQFAGRCRQLDLHAWTVDGEHHLVDDPHLDSAAARWLNSPRMHRHIQRAFASWSTCETPEPLTIFPGCRLIPFVHVHGSRRLATVVVAVFDAALLSSTHFDELCESAGMTQQQAQRALEATIRSSQTNVPHLEQVLRWSHRDLVDAQRSKNTLNEFSDRLAHTYEEISLLYGLGHSMNRVTDPRQFVAFMCTELLENMPFAWIAACFSRQTGVVEQLAGHVEVAGKLPEPDMLSLERLEHLFEQMGSPNWRPLLTVQQSDLPHISRAEVLAHPVRHDDHVIGVFLAGNKVGHDNEISSVETKFLDAAADFLSIYHENTARYIEQRTLFLGTVGALTASIDAKDRYTCGHSERVAQLAQILALAANMSEEMAEQYRIAGLVHDVGKIGVREQVLCKTGKLTAEEYEEIKRHPVIGYEILKDIPPLAEHLPGVLYHHERWDGKGYPQQLKGEYIPLIGRLLAVADTFDAMSSTRSYRPALPRQAVLKEITQCAGTQFDPDLAKLILQINLAPYDALMRKHQALKGFAA